jgi:putative endonuclease
MASKRNGTLYAGVTTDLLKRVYEHKNNVYKGFTAKYSVHMLVYFEEFNDITTAIEREKTIKGWIRKKKLALIESMNLEWKDLSEGWFLDSSPLAQNDVIR